MKVTFFGAALEVTGSCSLLEAAGQRILVDCGMFQGSDFNEGKNSDPLPFDPKSLNAVIVTHAHLDHTGRLPLLIRGGYDGFFYATPATIELTQLILQDALDVMTYNNHKFGSPILYNSADIAGVIQSFKPIEYYEMFTIGRDPIPTSPLKGGDKTASSPFKEGRGEVSVKFHDAGHIFGSVFAEVKAEGKTVVFSGDIGNVKVPILRDTDALPANVDLVVCESTYGDRLHEDYTKRRELLLEAINKAMNKGGVLMIPSFSLERTQELLYDLNGLVEIQKTLPRVPIYLDSPLAIGATKVYRKYTKYYDDEAEKLMKSGDELFNFPGLIMTLTREESQKINSTPGPKIIIAGAGMMNGGRIIHHALRYLSGKENTLLIIGYQAHGTLGRQIIDGVTPVKVMGESVPVRCSIQAIGAFSAHGDQNKLINWIGSGKNLPKKVCLNHGEPPASEALRKRLSKELGVETLVVEKDLTIEI